MHPVRYFFIALLVMLLALPIAVLSLDLGFMRPLYERLVSDLLEREVSIGGALSVRLWPELTVTAHQVDIAHAPARATSFAKVDSLEVRLDLASLLDKQINIPFLAIRGGGLELEIDEAGQGNWPKLGDETDTGEPPGYALRVTEATVESVTLQLRNGETNQTFDLDIQNLSANQRGGKVEVLGEGVINSRLFDTSLTVDGVQSLLVVNRWHMDWQGIIGAATFKSSGYIESVDRWMQSQLSATLHTESANQLLTTLSLPVIDDGPIDVRIELGQEGAETTLEVNAALGAFQLRGMASTDTPDTLESGQIKLVADGPNLAQIGALFNELNWPEAAFEAHINASLQDYRIDIKRYELLSDPLTIFLEGVIPDYRAPGTGALEGSIDVPSLAAFSDVLDLPTSLQGALKGKVSLTRSGEGTDVLISSATDFLSFELKGHIEPGETMLGSALTLSGQSGAADVLLGLAMDSPPLLPPLNFTGEFSIDEPQRLNVRSLSVRLGPDEIMAEGIVGWSDAVTDTVVTVTLDSPDLRTTLSPWVSAPEQIPALPAKANGQLSYPSTDTLYITAGSLAMAGGQGEFSGSVMLTESATSIAGTWSIGFPKIQPLLTTIEVPPHFEKPVSFEGDAQWRPGTLSVDIEEGKFRYGSTTFAGNLSLDTEAVIMRFDVQSSTPDITDYAPDDDDIAPAFSVPVSLRAVGELSEEAWSVEALQIESTQAKVESSGYLELDGDAFIDSHLKTAITIASLNAFDDLTTLALPDQGLNLSAELDSRGGALVIEQLDIQSGDSDLSLAGRLENPDDLKIDLAAISKELNLTPWIAMISGPAPVTAKDTAATKRDRLIPDIPIATDWFQQSQANFAVNVEAISGLARPVRNVEARGSVNPQGIILETLSAQNERGGTSRLSGEFSQPDDGPPRLNLKIDGSDLVLGIPKAPEEDINSLPPYSFKARLTGSGSTTRELASSLSGYVNVTMDEGKVLNTGLDRLTNSFLQELSNALNPFQDQQETTNINCAAAFASFEEGKVLGKPAVVVDTPNVKMLADVALDLETEKIQAQFKTVPQKGLGFSMSSLVNPYVEVTGTLSQPRLSLNPTNTVVGGSIAVMTGGISILVRNVLERMTTSGNICVTRLQKANEKMAELDGAT